MRKTFVAWLLSVACLLPSAARADSWIAPTTQEYVSPDGQWRLTVDPRPLTSRLAYFSDKVDGKSKAGGEPGDPQASAVGTLAHKVEGNWQQVWRKPLRNDVAPVEVVVLSGGAFMTLDNWHGMGFGPDAVVLYNDSGDVTAQYALTDILPKPYLRALPRSVSSLHWRGDAFVQPDGRTVGVKVRVPDQGGSLGNGSDSAFVVFVFDPRGGTIVRPDGPAWEQAQATAQRTLDAQIQSAEAAHRRFVAPLLGPADNSERGWHRYLVDAYFRLNPATEGVYPAAHFLRNPEAPDYTLSETWLHDALWDDATDGAIMLASYSQDALVSRLAIETKRMKPGALPYVQFYLALDDAHFAQASASLAKLGAKVIQLDPAIGIPQRPERLARDGKWDANKVGALDDNLFR